jgi:hypothetical protein
MIKSIDAKEYVGSIVVCRSERCGNGDGATVLGRLQEGKRQMVLVFAGNGLWRGGVVELVPEPEAQSTRGRSSRTHQVHIPLTSRVRCYRCGDVIDLTALRAEHVQAIGV